MTDTVLVAEDSLVVRSVLRRHLEREGYSVIEAVDGQTAIERCHDTPPDTVLLDIDVPGLNGHEVLAHLKSDWELKDIPVVFLSGKTNTKAIVAALHSGAQDYIKKPFATAELIARVGAAVRTKHLQDELRHRSAELDRISRTDALTGLYNRRHLEERLREVNSAAVRHNDALALVMLDIDYFKRINDDEGHQGGDEVLREITRRFKQHVRGEDVVGRWGGEEFLVIVAHTGIVGLNALAERIRFVVADQPFVLGDHQRVVTISAGCAAGPPGDTDDLIRRADAALYEAKNAGRNQVMVAALASPLGTASPITLTRRTRQAVPLSDEFVR
jgi:two-component system, cell cycle response regulator